ncbi:MAG: zinc ribbon domain-containing protein [Bryobacteraceae bacterium]|nr:zinc ribbon domain-containing protein [Bryobacteraceae bacterium]
MPIYEYKCAECGSKYEQIRRMSEADSGLECPGCKSEKVSRELYSTFATTSSSGSGQQMPMMGCGAQSCCAIKGGGCSSN